MAPFEHRVPLVGRRRPEHPEQRHLRRLVRQVEILAAVDHEDRLPDARREIHGVGLRRDGPRLEAPGHQDTGAQARLDGEVHRTELGAQAEPVESDAGAIDVGARLQVVDGAPQVLAALDADLA